MALKLLHNEQVREGGNKAQWPFESSYTDPVRTGYLFEGWKYKNRVYTPQEYSSQSNNPFGPITEDTDIFGVWDKLTIHAATNHTFIGGDGDTDADPTKLSYWISSEKGKMITQDVVLEEVSLDSGMLKISFENVGTSVVDNKNVATKKAVANDSEDSRYYRFRAKTNKYGGMQSDVIEIEQAGKDQIILMDFDYLTFRYNWSAQDGTDLDTATYIFDSGIVLQSGKPLETYPVGWNTAGSQKIDHDYSGPSKPSELFLEVSKYIKGGGDNLQSGNESALINLREVCNNLPSGVSKIRCELYGNWYRERGDGNCNLTFQTWKTPSGEGGMQLDRDSSGKTKFTFSPTGDTVLRTTERIDGNVYASSKENGIHSEPYSEDKCYSHVATLVYDVITKNAVLTNRMRKRSGRNVCFDVTVNNQRRNVNAVTSYCDETEVEESFTFEYGSNVTNASITINSAKLYIDGVAHNVYLYGSESYIEPYINCDFIEIQSFEYNDENYINKINFKLLDSDEVKTNTFELRFTEVEDTIFEGKTFVPQIRITIKQES